MEAPAGASVDRLGARLTSGILNDKKLNQNSWIFFGPGPGRAPWGVHGANSRGVRGAKLLPEMRRNAMGGAVTEAFFSKSA